MIVMSLCFGVPTYLALRRRTGEWGKLNFLPGTLLVSAVLVLLSRLLNFQPGYFSGALAGFAFAAALPPKSQGRLTAANWVWALGLSVGAWFLSIPVAEAAAQPDAGLLWVALEACLVLTFLWGLEGLTVAMLPMRFLDGEKVREWSRVVWSILLFLGVFSVVHVLLAPNRGYLGRSGCSPCSWPSALSRSASGRTSGTRPRGNVPEDALAQ